jgi:hypothetical protein
VWAGDIAVTIYAAPAMSERVLAALEPVNAERVGTRLSEVAVGSPGGPSELQAPDAAPCARIQGRDRELVPFDLGP